MGLLKIGLLAALITIFLGTFSGARGDDDVPVFHIQQVDPTFESQKMAGPGVKVHSAGEFNSSEWKIPSIETRNDLFLKAGLKEDVSSWDEMKKDILFLTARDSTVRALVKNYPKISKEKLLELAKLTKQAPK